MTATKRFRIVIFSALVLAVLLITACFSVSFAKWEGNNIQATVEGSIGKFYVDYKTGEDNKAVRSFSVDTTGEYKNYICVSNESGDAGTVYLVFDVTVKAGGEQNCWFRINRSETDKDGNLTGNLLNIDGPLKLPDDNIKDGAFLITPAQLDTDSAATADKKYYIPLNFTADNKYYALNFVINANSVNVKFDFTAKVTTKKPVTTVRFDANGGYLTNGAVGTQTLSDGDKVARISAPARNTELWSETSVDFMFGGWFTKAALNEQNSNTIWNFDTAVGADDITLYAKWIIKNDHISSWYVSVNGNLHEMTDVNDNFNPNPNPNGWTNERIITLDLSAGDELRFYPEGSMPALTCETGADIIVKNAIDNSATIVTGGKYTLYYKVNADKSNSALALLPASDVVTVKFDVGKTQLSIADKTVSKGTKVERPTDPAVPGSKTDIFIDWYTTKTVNGDTVTYSNLYDFDTAVNEDITLYAKWHTVGGSLYLRKNDDTNFLTVDVGIAATTTVEGTLTLEKGDKVYLYNTWDSALPYEMKEVKGTGLSKTAGKPYLTVDTAGTYTLQATQKKTNDVSEYTMVIADRWTAAEQTLADGTYIYLANATAATDAERFIKMTEVGYIESGATAQGIAAVMSNVAAGTQIKLVTVTGGKVTLAETSLTGKGATASKVKHDYVGDFDGNAEFVTSHSVGGAYSGDYGKYIVELAAEGTYRVYLSPDNKLSVVPAVGGISASTNVAAGEYYAVGTFSDYKINSANKLNATTFEGIYETGADFVCTAGHVYRLVKIDSVSNGVPTVSYMPFTKGGTVTKDEFVSGDSCLSYDEYTGAVSTTPAASRLTYRFIVDGNSAPSSITYRTDITGADQTLTGTFTQVPDKSAYFMDVTDDIAIASLTVNGGGEINKLSVGSASFSYEKGKSYRINQTSVGEQPLTSSITKYAAYSINDHTPVVMVEADFTPSDVLDHSFETVLTVAKGNKLKFSTGGYGDINCSDLWIFSDVPCEYSGQNTANNSNFPDDCAMTIKESGTYRFYFQRNPNNGSKWDVNAEKLTSVPETELGTVKIGANGTAQKYIHLGNSIAYESNGKIGRVNLSMPTGYKGDDGNPMYTQAELYTLDSKSTAENYIAPGTSFMIYRNGRRVEANMYFGSSTKVAETYRITRNGFNYTIKNESTKVSGKFIIGVSAAADAVSVNFIGGNAATKAETNATGWYVVGIFSNWQLFEANKMTPTNIEGVYTANLDFVVTETDSNTLYDKYKIVYSDGSNLIWYAVNGTTPATGGEMTATSTTFYVDEFKAGTSGMYRTNLNMYRILFSQYDKISNKSMSTKRPKISYTAGGTSHDVNMIEIRKDSSTASTVFYYDLSVTQLPSNSSNYLVIKFESPHSTANTWKSNKITANKFENGYSYTVTPDYLGHWDYWDLDWSPTVTRYNGTNYVAY